MNMARHRNNPNMPFWKMIKEGNDHFEVTQQEPKVDFCEKKYVFDAVKAPDAKRDPVFEASAKCPAYAIPDEIAEAVREKQEQDEPRYAKLVAKGTPVARLNTGIDGGMNKVFAAASPAAIPGCRKAAMARACRWSHSRARPARSPGPSIRRTRPARMSRSSPRRRLRSRAAPADPRRHRQRRARSPTASSATSPARSASAAPIPPRHAAAAAASREAERRSQAHREAASRRPRRRSRPRPSRPKVRAEAIVGRG